jgi:hypothetical protein
MTAARREQAFRQLLARKAGKDPGVPAIAAAARHLCERFAHYLTPVIGEAGIAAIWARSLHLVQRQLPLVAPLEGSDQREGPFAGLQGSLEQQEAAVAAKAAVAVLTTASELLTLFIGESLTTRLLREAWPDDFAGD